jgi:transcriptional regulator with XRE-family HTH domain
MCAVLANLQSYLASPFPLIYIIMIQKPIPNNLRSYREKAGLRQVDVAKRLGFTSYDRICHWEKGRMLPSLPNLLKLAVLYKVPIEKLYEEYLKEINSRLTGETADMPLPAL